RTPMGSPSRISGLGGYMSPALQKRYPGIEFSQFDGAEMLARKHDISKASLDEYSLASHEKAMAATRAGAFDDEIVALAVETEKGKDIHKIDEGIRFDATLQSIGGVKLLREGGRITAANASQICDGA